ncbi:lactate racemase domain-containing protein [bacterium]
MLIGKGYSDQFLSEEEIQSICSDAITHFIKDGQNVLFIIPDHSRTAPIDKIFKIIYKILSSKVDHLDFLIALGTHPPMNERMINQRVGITQDERNTTYSKARFFNHHWDNPEQLLRIGTLSESDVSEISNGLMECSVDVTINKMVMDYDQLMIIGPTFPHEVVGFSGGNKYLFPGISGAEIINMFHWLGALLTSMQIIGHANTSVRQVVDKAARFLQVPVNCISLVVKGNDLAGIYAGSSREAWQKAAQLSEKLHIIFKAHPFKSVLSCAPEMYDDLWTGAKCMYKLEPVVADHGELIIYAPHISEVSVTHGNYLKQIGYHTRDYFLDQWDRFKDFPGGVLAHSTHVKGVGTYQDGIELPRIKVTLATSISKEDCEQINLNYRAPESIQPNRWMDREDEGFLYVQKAGEMLYRVKV